MPRTEIARQLLHHFHIRIEKKIFRRKGLAFKLDNAVDGKVPDIAGIGR